MMLDQCHGGVAPLELDLILPPAPHSEQAPPHCALTTKDHASVQHVAPPAPQSHDDATAILSATTTAAARGLDLFNARKPPLLKDKSLEKIKLEEKKMLGTLPAKNSLDSLFDDLIGVLPTTEDMSRGGVQSAPPMLWAGPSDGGSGADLFRDLGSLPRLNPPSAPTTAEHQMHQHETIKPQPIALQQSIVAKPIKLMIESKQTKAAWLAEPSIPGKSKAELIKESRQLTVNKNKAAPKKNVLDELFSAPIVCQPKKERNLPASFFIPPLPTQHSQDKQHEQHVQVLAGFQTELHGAQFYTEVYTEVVNNPCS
jgi:hypothetical protein